MMNNMYDILNKMRQLNENVDPVAFAALAPPKDKITFADKIAGAKKEVDEMLGDVAAEAMKKAVHGMAEDDVEEGLGVYLPKHPLGKVAKAARKYVPGQKQSQAKERELGTNAWIQSLKYDNPEDEVDRVMAPSARASKRYAKIARGEKPFSEADMEEGNDFTGARQAAIRAGKPTFSVAGKTYKVTGDTSDEKMMEKKEKTLWPGTPEYEKKFPKTMKPGEKTRSSTGGEIEKTATGVKHTAKAHDDEDEKDTKADDGAPKKKGRPKGKDKGPERVTAKAWKHKGSRVKEGDEAEGDDVKQAMALLKKHGYKVSKEIEEKAVSKAQQRFMGMVHAAQKGEKPASKEVAKVAKEMPKKAAKDYAKTKHAGLPEKVKTKKEESKEEVEETTTSGSVATAPADTPKGKKGMVFGKGVYEGRLEESYKSRLEQMLTEGMSINASQNEDGSKTLSVTATDDDAMKLAQILQLAGMEQAHGYEEACPACGQAPCGCEQGLEEADLANAPEPVYADTEMINDQGDDLHKRKNTGQATLPTIYRGMDRQTSLSRVYEEVREDAERKLWDLYKKYENK